MFSALLLTLASALPQEPAAPRPNVLVLLLDDLGLEVLECYDSENIFPPGIAERAPHVYPRTPNLSRLARAGVRFTQARVPPTCSPTRASLLSGRYPFRHGIGGVVRRSDASPAWGTARTIEFGVGPGNREWTLAHLARTAGHASFHAGKWHLALLEKSAALAGEPGYGWGHIAEVAGFDDYWATWANLPGYPKPETWTASDGTDHRPGYSNFVACANGEVENVRGAYVTSVQVDRVLEYVDRRGDEPWLIHCAFNAAHAPFQIPPEQLVSTGDYVDRARAEMEKVRRSASLERSTFPFYCATVEALDHEVGRLLDGLQERGRLEDTVVFLLADNGTPGLVMRHAVIREGLDLGPLVRGFVRVEQSRFKHSVWECGVRVPLIVTGPVVGSPGRTSDALVDVTDVFATVRELLAVELRGVPDGHVFDGHSLLPILRSPEGRSARRSSFFEHYEPNGAPPQIRAEEGDELMLRRGFVLETPGGRFKIVRDPGGPAGGGDLFFHLSDAEGRPVDPWETRPLGTETSAPTRDRYLEVRSALEELLASEG